MNVRANLCVLDRLSPSHDERFTRLRPLDAPVIRGDDPPQVHAREEIPHKRAPLSRDPSNVVALGAPLANLL